MTDQERDNLLLEISKRLDSMDKRLDSMDKRLGIVKDSFDELLGTLKSPLAEEIRHNMERRWAGVGVG